MNRLLKSVLTGVMRSGNLTIIGHDGEAHVFGDGTGTPCHVALRSRRAEFAITLDPELGVPEAYMDGELEILEGDLVDLLAIAYRNVGPTGTVSAAWTKPLERVRMAMRRLQQINTEARSRRNVRHHYDLSGELYRLFLDSDLQYSCAYFTRPDATLEEAQAAKKRLVMSKLQLADGQCVLDIGSGWGGLALDIARAYDTDILGVTLSTEQHAVATARAQDEGLDGRVHFDLKDYRDLQQRFDRIVSVGMFEHVGVNHYQTFFGKCASLLKPDGVMVLHTIGRSGPPSVTAAFIRKYIFPGGYIPALSEILPAVERAGLVLCDVEILRLHYAETLKLWRQRFRANWAEAARLYDERFCRMWDFYLAASEASFRWQDTVVFQLQLARRNDVLPVTRDYMSARPPRAAARPARRRQRERS
jgi:cyclopropane-fatty-acyl-phospholipid synthase